MRPERELVVDSAWHETRLREVPPRVLVHADPVRRTPSAGGWASGSVWQQDGWAPLPAREAPELVPTLVLEVPDALVSGGGAVFTADGTFLSGASMVFSEGARALLLNEIEATTSIADAQVVAEVDEAGTLLQPGDHIFGHWLLDIVPRLDAIAAVGVTDMLVRADRPTFVDAMVSAFAPQARLQAVAPARADGTFVRVRRLFVATSARQGPFFDRSRLAVYDRLLGSVPTPPLRPEKVLVSRSELDRPGLPTTRRLVNADEVERACRASGFVEWHPERAPLGEQAAAAHQAESLVGEDGSGLHLALWSRPGASLTVLSSVRRRNALHIAVAEARHLHYRLFQGPVPDEVMDGLRDGTVTREVAYSAPWSVDIPALERALAAP